MAEDIVRALGRLALGTRLKRIGERLQAQTQELLEAEGVATPASHLPLLEAVARLGPASIGDLADALGAAQPGVTRMADRLEEEGLVQSAGSADRRVRALALSPAGRRLIARARAKVWPRIDAALADACETGRGDLLARLTALEAALDAESLAERAERADAPA